MTLIIPTQPIAPAHLTGQDLALLTALQTGTLENIATAVQQGGDPYLQHRGQNAVMILANRIRIDRNAGDEDVHSDMLFFCKALTVLVVEGKMDLEDSRLLKGSQTPAEQMRHFKNGSSALRYLGANFAEVKAAIANACRQKGLKVLPDNEEPEVSVARMSCIVIRSRPSM